MNYGVITQLHFIVILNLSRYHYQRQSWNTKQIPLPRGRSEDKITQDYLDRQTQYAHELKCLVRYSFFWGGVFLRLLKIPVKSSVTMN